MILYNVPSRTGIGIRPETWDLIEKAYESKGIIVFTDPDHAGDQIRRRILERFPDAKEAFLDRSQAEKDGDIGIENASAESIREALRKVHRSAEETSGEAGKASGAEGGTDGEEAPQREPFTAADLFCWGLDGTPGAAKRRRASSGKRTCGAQNARVSGRSARGSLR